MIGEPLRQAAPGRRHDRRRGAGEPVREPLGRPSGVEWWEAQGYRVKLAEHVLARDDFVAGDARDRGADLNGLFADPEVDVVQCLQGGYGSAQVIPHLDFDVIAANPEAVRRLLGHHGAPRRTPPAARARDLLRHGLLGMGDPETTAFSKERLLAVLGGAATGEVPENPDDPYLAHDPGRPVTAPLVGGCLWLLMQTMGTPWEIDLDGAILFFEDYDLPPYYLDGFLVPSWRMPANWTASAES